MISKSLSGIWKMRESNDTNWCEVRIPGSVLSGYLEQEKIENPYYRNNEYEVRELMRKDYEFVTDFVVEEDLINEECIDLIFYGLDTLARIYLNGTCIQTTNNMHRTYRIPAKEYCKHNNELRIVFESPIEYIEAYECEEGNEITNVPCSGMKGNQYLRKAHSMFGWDWGPQLPDMGIFREVTLEAYSHIKMKDAKIKQLHKRETVELDIEVGFERLGKNEHCFELLLEITDPLGEEVVSEQVLIEENVAHVTAIIKQPKLWWPNGHGEHPLYNVKISCRETLSKTIYESKNYRIGLRTIGVSQEKDEFGKEFAITVNGVKIFAKGANYIPEDCIYSDITKERIEYLIKSSVRANFNCLRVWGGGYYPSDIFYDLCDENGIIVWQDLMFACNIYDVTKEFEDNIIAEVRDNVTRLRHHACLGLWCGNNEIETAWHNWGSFQAHSQKLRADYIKQFEYILPKVLKECDSETFYWPSSPSSGGCFDNPGDENRGDTHYWDVWHGQKPFSDYQKHYFRFCSEFGFQSFPCMKTVASFTEPEDRNIFSKVMESHQKNDAANGKILYYISENFLYPKDFESLIYVSQLLQGIAIKSGVEHWRRNRGRCMGSLYWQINDNWPVASWASIDYYGRWKALHYMAKEFFEQVAGSIVRNDNQISIYVTNENLTGQSVFVRIRLKDMHFNVIQEDEYELMVGAQESVQIATIDYSKLLEKRKEELFVEARFTYSDGRSSVECETFVPYKHLHLKKPSIVAKLKEETDCFILTLTADYFAPFVELDLKETDVIWSDNYFYLTEEEPKKIKINKSDIMRQKQLSLEEIIDTLTVRSLYDSISHNVDNAN